MLFEFSFTFIVECDAVSVGSARVTAHYRLLRRVRVSIFSIQTFLNTVYVEYVHGVIRVRQESTLMHAELPADC